MPPPRTTPSSPVALASAASAENPLKTSERVILHILSQGRLGPNELAPIGLSQAGIGEALGLRQSSLAKTLARLVAAGVLRAERRHVEHQNRRLLVYELTPLGESLARDLRKRATAATRPDSTARVGRIQFGR